jgi:hypothetical protein
VAADGIVPAWALNAGAPKGHPAFSGEIMKSSAIVGLLVVAACATSGGGTGATANADVGNVGGGDQSGNIKHVIIGNTELGADAQSRGQATWHDMAAPVSVTWRALPAAYKQLGLSITRYDSTAHVIEGERLRSRADFGGKELISMIDCGDVAGMPNVTRFDVNIQVRTALRGSATASSVASVVAASAKPSDVAGVLMPCVVNEGAADQVAATVAEVLAANHK